MIDRVEHILSRAGYQWYLEMLAEDWDSGYPNRVHTTYVILRVMPTDLLYDPPASSSLPPYLPV